MLLPYSHLVMFSKHSKGNTAYIRFISFQLLMPKIRPFFTIFQRPDVSASVCAGRSFKCYRRRHNGPPGIRGKRGQKGGNAGIPGEATNVSFLDIYWCPNFSLQVSLSQFCLARSSTYGYVESHQETIVANIHDKSGNGIGFRMIGKSKVRILCQTNNQGWAFMNNAKLGIIDNSRYHAQFHPIKFIVLSLFTNFETKLL